MKVTSQPPLPPTPPNEGAARSVRPLAPSPGTPHSLTLGQLVQGRMVGVNPAGESMVEIGGRVVAFRPPVALPLGKEVWVEVVNAGVPPLLALADKKGITAELLRLLLPERGAMGKAVAGLTQLTADAGLAGAIPPEPGQELRDAIATLAVDGQADTKKLLKLLAAFAPGGHPLPGKAGGVPSLLSQLTEYANLMANAKPAEGDKPEVGLVKLAKALELMQNLNQQPAVGEQAPLYLAPCFFTGSAGWGEWMFWGSPEEGGEAGGGEQYGLAFYLEMSQLGDLHLQVTVRDQALHGQFAVANPEVLDHLQAQLPELQSLLEGLGYRPVHLACRVAPRDLHLEFKNDLEQKAALASCAMVNVVV